VATQEVYPSKETAFFTFDYYYETNPNCPILSHQVSKFSGSQVSLDNGM
jgi:hypothetical protein